MGGDSEMGEGGGGSGITRPETQDAPLSLSPRRAVEGQALDLSFPIFATGAVRLCASSRTP